jgi:hypothetical protein
MLSFENALHTELLVLFVTLQSFMVVFFFLQINGLLGALDRNFDDTAADQVAAVSFSYSLKVNQVQLTNSLKCVHTSCHTACTYVSTVH